MTMKTTSKRVAVRKRSQRAQRLLNSAKYHCRRGYEVLPLASTKTGDASTGKRPITRHGVKDATSDFVKFKELIGGHKRFNLGIATGPGSKIMVIDVDPRNGGNGSMKQLISDLGALPHGPVCDTGGGGKHYYFAWPDDFTFNKTTLGDGIDVLGANSYVVAPPSRHHSGRRYSWQADRDLRDVAPPPLSAPWLVAIKARLDKRSSPKDTGATAAASASVDGHDRLTHPILEGQRNMALTSIAGMLKASGRSIDEIQAELLRANREQCQPPLDEAEVMKIVGSAATWAAPVSTAGDPELVAKRLLDMHYGGGALLRHERDGEFYAFVGTHWGQLQRATLKSRAYDIIKTQFPSARKRLNATANEAITIIETLTTPSDDRLHFETAPPQVINVLNGEIWLLPDGSHELRPHAPATGCRHVLPIEYDPDAKCPIYDKATGEIFSKAKTPGVITKRWYETMGYIMQPSRKKALVFVLQGPGGNGKSLEVGVLTGLLGQHAVYSGDINQIEGNRFAIAGLVGKLALIDDDVKSGSLFPDGMLKKLSEEKLLTAERKHKDQFNFVCRVVPVLLCNNMPSITDMSPGMKRRLVVFKFENEIKEKDQDLTLLDRIRERELAGVLNHALRGWQRFVSKGHQFTPSQDIDRASRELLAQSNSFATFVEEECLVSPEARTNLGELYDAYTQFCKKAGYRNVIARNTVKRNIAHMGFKYVTVQGYPTIVGLKLKVRRASDSSWKF